MRASSFWIIAISSSMLTACSPGFDAGEKKNKEEIVSENADLQRKLAMASEAGGDLAAAERMYSKLAESGSVQSSIELASFYTRNNKAENAVRILEKTYAANPKDTALMRAYANSLISAGKAPRALELLDAAIAGGNSDAYVYNSRGVALDTLGQYKQAQQSYRKALSLNPSEEADFKTNLSMSYILSGEYHTAIETLEPMMTKGSTPQSRQNLALAYGLTGDMETAMRIGSKDISLKEMKENIRFYQHFSESKGTSSLKKEVPALSMDTPPAKAVTVTATEGELPPPPPPPMKNLTQYPADVQPVAIAPVAIAPVVATTAQSPSQQPEKTAAVTEKTTTKVANPNYIDQYTPSPKPIEPVKIAPEGIVPAAAPMANAINPEPVQHKMLTPKPAPKETGAVPSSEAPKAQEDELKNEEVLNLQPSAGGIKKQSAKPSPSDILNSRESAKLMESMPTQDELKNLQPAAGNKQKQDAGLSSSDILNKREAERLLNEPIIIPQDKGVQDLQPAAGGSASKNHIPAPALKPDNW